jgi:hypothetical protein
MTYHSHDDRIEYRADTIMRRTDYWVLTALGGIGLIIFAVVWALV